MYASAYIAATLARPEIAALLHSHAAAADASDAADACGAGLVAGPEAGAAPGEAQEVPNERAAIRRAEAMSRDPANAGALAFKRSGDPNVGNFGDAVVLKTFGEVPANLDEL